MHCELVDERNEWKKIREMKRWKLDTSDKSKYHLWKFFEFSLFFDNVRRVVFPSGLISMNFSKMDMLY